MNADLADALLWASARVIAIRDAFEARYSAYALELVLELELERNLAVLLADLTQDAA